ncbi:unnamed protein product, partial [Didymodactylos carnosus]
MVLSYRVYQKPKLSDLKRLENSLLKPELNVYIDPLELKPWEIKTTTNVTTTEKLIDQLLFQCNSNDPCIRCHSNEMPKKGSRKTKELMKQKKLDYETDPNGTYLKELMYEGHNLLLLPGVTPADFGRNVLSELFSDDELATHTMPSLHRRKRRPSDPPSLDADKIDILK